MTKEQLKQYRTLKLELEDVNACIHQNIIQDSVQGSMKDHPYILQNRSVKGVTDENYSLLTRKSELKAQISEIEKFVEGIGDYEIKKAIQIYYVDKIEPGDDKPTWENVADKISNGVTGPALKVKLGRYLRNHKKI